MCVCVCGCVRERMMCFDLKLSLSHRRRIIKFLDIITRYIEHITVLDDFRMWCVFICS